MRNTSISRGFLNRTFPFFFQVDRNMVIRDAGKSLLKIDNSIIQKNCLDIFKIKRPVSKQFSFESLLESQDELILLEFKVQGKKILYKTQCFYLEEERRLLFLGSLFLKDPADIITLNLSLADFSLSDSTVDMLQLLQLNNTATHELKELNSRLKTNEIKYRNLVENATEMIFSTDLLGNITFINEIGLKVLDQEDNFPDEFSFVKIVNGRFKKLLLHTCSRLLREETEVAYVELKLELKKEIWVGLNLSLMMNELGPIGYSGIAHDITEKKRFEQIIIAEKEKAQHAVKAKSRFLANMSHEIRTPLNGIMGLTNLLLETELTAKQKKYMEAIVSSSETLMVVINDILDISKIEAGKLRFSLLPFNLHNCLSQLTEMMNSKAIAKGISMEYHQKISLPEILIGDQARLNQILYNIVGNAIKFTDQGKVKLTASATLNGNGSCQLFLDIKDTGIGISKEKQDHIFGAFRQVEGNDSRKYQGTGLGLTISKRLIEAQGGTLNIESKIDQGSTFSIMIPAKIYSNGDLEPSSKTFSDLNKNYDFSGLKILLAEDNPVNQMLTVDILNSKKINVDVAINGQEALNLTKSFTYDAILMDMQMPIMDGYQAMRTIRADKDLSGMPILALTAHVNEQEVQKCMDAGATAYLSKPFKPEILFEKIALLTELPEQKNGSTFDIHEANKNEKPMNENIPPKKTATEDIDFTMLKTFTNNNSSIIQSTLQLLLSEIPKDLREIEHEIKQENFDRIKAIAHRSKPNFKLVCQNTTATILEEIESLCNSSDNLSVITDKFSQLQAIENDLLQAIQEEINHHA